MNRVLWEILNFIGIFGTSFAMSQAIRYNPYFIIGLFTLLILIIVKNVHPKR